MRLKASYQRKIIFLFIFAVLSTSVIPILDESNNGITQELDEISPDISIRNTEKSLERNYFDDFNSDIIEENRFNGNADKYISRDGIYQAKEFPFCCDIGIEGDALIKADAYSVEYVLKLDAPFNPKIIDFDAYNIGLEDYDEKQNVLLVNLPWTSFKDQNHRTNILLNKLPVIAKEPNYYYQVDEFIPNDTNWTQQWAPAKINLTQAWDTQIGKRNVVVAVIDTGIDYTNPDLVNNYLPLGWDHVNDDNDPMDDHSHGTHVAGTIAAAINNQLHVAGVANVTIIAEKFLSASGSGSSFDAAAAIRHAVDMGADILSNSWGGGSYSTIVKDAIDYANRNNVLVIAAAGNDATDNLHYPSAYEGVIAVGSTNENDELSYFSNYGDWVDITAPGSNIISTVLNNQTAIYSGTSMATPHVSGVSALIMSQYPDYSIRDVERHLYRTTDDLGVSGWDRIFGWGRINALTALEPIYDRDLTVSLTINEQVEVEVQTELVFKPVNLGKYDITDHSIQLKIGGNLIPEEDIMYFSTDEIQLYFYYWTPLEQKKYTIELSIFGSGDTNSNNDILTRNITAIKIVEYQVDDDYYTWYDAKNNGDLLELSGDDVFTNYTLPFNFTFYDKQFDEIFVSSNGWFSFYHKEPYSYSPPSFPTDKYQYVIAPVWDDLRASNNIYVNCTSDYVVFGFDNYQELGGGVIGTFEVVLYKSGYIGFNFQSMSTLFGFTSGINLGWNDYGLQFNDGISGASEYGILYTRPSMTDDLSAQLEMENTIFPVNNSRNITVSIQNLGLTQKSGVEYEFYINNTLVDDLSGTVSLESNEIYSELHAWTPTKAGKYNLTVIVFNQTNSDFNLNNRETVWITITSLEIVSKTANNIGIMLAHDENTPYDIIAFYEGLGYTTDFIYDIADYDLSEFDMIVIEEWGGTWPSYDIQKITDYLNFGGTVFISGDSGMGNLDWTADYGLFYQGSSGGSSGTSSNVFSDHVTKNVNSLYFPGPVDTITLTTGQELARDSGNTTILLAKSDTVRLVIFSDDLDGYIAYADSAQLMINIIEWRFEHDLLAINELVSGQKYIKDVPYDFNIGLKNIGNQTETNLNFSIYIDGSLQNAYALIPSLGVDENYIISYNHIFVSTGTHNVSIFVDSVVNETNINNNVNQAIFEVIENPVGIVTTLGQDNLIEIQKFYNSRGYYTIEINNLSSVPLQYYNSILIGEGGYLNEDEKVLLREYLEIGGKILSIGTHTYSEDWTSEFGISRGEFYIDTGYTGNYIQHHLTKGVGEFYVSNSYSLDIKSGYSLVLDKSSTDSFIAVSTRYNLVVVASDMNDVIYNGDNSVFLFNFLTWEEETNDLAINLILPSHIKDYSENIITITVSNIGTDSVSSFEVYLSIDGITLLNFIESSLTLNTRESVNYTVEWFPSNFQEKTIYAEIKPIDGETSLGNNIIDRLMRLRQIEIISPVQNELVDNPHILFEYEIIFGELPVSINAVNSVNESVSVSYNSNHKFVIPISENGLQDIIITFEWQDGTQLSTRVSIIAENLSPSIDIVVGDYFLEELIFFDSPVYAINHTFVSLEDNIANITSDFRIIMDIFDVEDELDTIWRLVNLVNGYTLNSSESSIVGSHFVYLTNIANFEENIRDKIGTSIIAYDWDEFYQITGYDSDTHNYIIQYEYTEIQASLLDGFMDYMMSFDFLIVQNITYTSFRYTPSSPQLEDKTTVNVELGSEQTHRWEINSSLQYSYQVNSAGKLEYSSKLQDNSYIDIKFDYITLGTHNLTLVVEDRIGQQINDEFTIVVTEDISAPEFTFVGNNSIEVGSQISIYWEITDSSQGTFTFYSNGMVYSSGVFNKLETIEVSMFASYVTEYNFTIIASDYLNHSSSVTTIVSITDTVNPNIITEYGEIIIPRSTDNIVLNWSVFDYTPSYYEIYEENELLSYGGWNNLDSISLELNDLGSNRNITLFVFDSAGNQAFQQVLITIVSDTDFALLIGAGVGGLMILGTVTVIIRRKLKV